MPCQNMIVPRLNVAVLPLDLPWYGLKTQWGEILTTDKPHKKKTEGLFLKDESEIWHLHHVKIKFHCTWRSFIMFPQGVRSLTLLNGGTTDTCSGLPLFYGKKDGLHLRVTLWNVPSDDNVPRKTCFLPYFLKNPGKKLVQLSFILIYSSAWVSHETEIKCQLRFRPLTLGEIGFVPTGWKAISNPVLGWMIYRTQK